MPDTSLPIIFNVFSGLLFTAVLETMSCCLYLGLLLLNGTLLVRPVMRLLSNLLVIPADWRWSEAVSPG